MATTALSSSFAHLTITPAPLLEPPVPLSELKAKAKAVQPALLANHIRLRYQEILKERLGDTQKATVDAHYQYNRLKLRYPDFEDSYITRTHYLEETSAVSVENRDYVLFSCPKDEEFAGEQLDAMLQRDITLFVSLIESTEPKENIFNNFWTAEKVVKIVSLNDWKFSVKEQRTLFQVFTSSNTPKAALYETTITATHATEVRELTHLHLDGWKDGKAVPDQYLFLQLLARIEELQEILRYKKQNDCVATHCFAGIGRTGATILQLHLRHQIRAMLQKGHTFETASVDIPKLVTEFRMQRRLFMERSHVQIAESYQLAGQYVDLLYRQKQEIAKYVPRKEVWEYACGQLSGFEKRAENEFGFRRHYRSSNELQLFNTIAYNFTSLASDIEFHVRFSDFSTVVETDQLSVMLENELGLVPFPKAKQKPEEFYALHAAKIAESSSVVLLYNDKNVREEPYDELLHGAALQKGFAKASWIHKVVGCSTLEGEAQQVSFLMNRLEQDDTLLKVQKPSKKVVFYDSAFLPIAVSLFLSIFMKKRLQQQRIFKLKEQLNIPHILCCFGKAFDAQIDTKTVLLILHKIAPLLFTKNEVALKR